MNYYKLDKNGVDFKKNSTPKLIIQLSWLVILLGILTWLFFPFAVIPIEKIPFKVINQAESFDTIKLKQLLIDLNVQNKDIVYSQAIVESGNFTSNLFKQNNNMFGMKEAKQRPTLALGSESGYAYYKTWQDCVIDYALWQSAYGRGLTNKQYLELLGSIYAEDSSYTIKIKNLIK